MHRLLVIAAALGIVTSVVGAPVPAPTLKGNRAAAFADANRLVGSVRVPPGAQLVSRGRAKAVGGHTYGVVGSTIGAVATGDWRIRGSSLAAVGQYVRGHAPSGSKLTEDGSGGSTTGGVNELDYGFSFPLKTGVLDLRQVDVYVKRGHGGVIDLSATAESIWVEPRPRSERFSGRAIETVVRNGKGKVIQRRTVTTAGRVQRTLGYLNRLPTIQPFVGSCYMISSGRDTLTLSVLPRVGAKPTASISYYAGVGGSADRCDPVTVKVGGRDEPGLEDGRFVATLKQAIGVRFPF